MRGALLLLSLLLSPAAFAEETDAEAHARVQELERTCRVLAEKAEARLAKNTPAEILDAARTFDTALSLDSANETAVHARLLAGRERARSRLRELARPMLAAAEWSLLQTDRETAQTALRQARAIDPYERTAADADAIEAKLLAQVEILAAPCEGLLAELTHTVEIGSVRALLDARGGLRALANDPTCEATRVRAQEVHADCLNRLMRIVDGALDVLASHATEEAKREARALALVVLEDPELRGSVLSVVGDPGELHVDFRPERALGVTPRIERLFRGSPHGDGAPDPLSALDPRPPRG